MKTNQKFGGKLPFTDVEIETSLSITNEEIGKLKAGKRSVKSLLLFFTVTILFISLIVIIPTLPDHTTNNRKKQSKSLASLSTATSKPGEPTIVTLPDGSRVYLYGESTLWYPSTLENDTLLVELQGEAYFEVAKKTNRIFQVKTKDQIIDVTGTHFKVSTYKGITTTILLEGSIRLKAGNVDILMDPGERAILNNKKINFYNFGTQEESIAWLKDDLRISYMPIKSILSKFEAWYDVTFINKVPASDSLYSMDWSKKDPLAKALEKLKQNCSVRIVVTNQAFNKGDTITIK